MRVRVLCVSVVIGGVLAGAPAALADAPVSTVSEVAAAVVAEGQPAAAALSSIDLPVSGSEPVSGPGGIELGLPATGAASVVGNTAVYRSDESSKAQVAVQAVAGGVRALVNIDSAAAPERYDFPLGGEVAALRAEADGSVTTLNAAGAPIGIIAPAWAVDKNGTSVPTHDEINGTTLTQVVEHQGGGYAYGITADPAWFAVLAVRACLATRCYNWMPSFIAAQWQIDPYRPAVLDWIKRNVCGRTPIC